MTPRCPSPPGVYRRLASGPEVSPEFAPALSPIEPVPWAPQYVWAPALLELG